jgi:hypothetical protein
MRAVHQRGLTLREAIAHLRSEGWHVDRHHVAHAIAVNAIPDPPKRGGWRRFTAEHVDGLRRYLAERSRSQPREAGK